MVTTCEFNNSIADVFAFHKSFRTGDSCVIQQKPELDKTQNIMHVP